MNRILNKLNENKLFLLQIITFFIASQFFVPTNDDLRFKINQQWETIPELFNQTLNYGNGRLIGNAIAIFFSHGDLIQYFYFLEVFMLALFAICIEKILKIKNIKTTVIASVIIMIPDFFKEIVSWMCCVANYFFPICLLTISVAIIIDNKNYSKSKNAFLSALVFIIGFSEQLFVEHNTIVNILVALVLIVFYKIVNPKSICLLISNILGSIIMFSYKYYVDYDNTFVALTSPEYRKTIFSIGGIKNYLLEILLKNLQFPILILSGSVMLCVILYFPLKKVVKNQHKKILIIYGITAIISFITSVFINIMISPTEGLITGDFGKKDKIMILSILSLVILILMNFFCFLLLSYKYLFKIISKKELMTSMIMLVLSAIAFSPFLFIRPCGYRCCLLSLFLIFMLEGYYVGLLKKYYNINIEKLNKTIAIVSIVVTFVYFAFYAKEKYVYNLKEQFCFKSNVLPSNNDRFVSLGDNELYWDKLSASKHKYVSLAEFKKIMNIN